MRKKKNFKNEEKKSTIFPKNVVDVVIAFMPCC